VAEQLAQLLPLLWAERCHQPHAGGLTARQRIDQLLDCLRVFTEELAMTLHEVSELVSRVLLPRMGGQQRVEVGQHVLDPLHGLRVGGFQSLLDARELGVQHLTLQHALIASKMARASSDRHG
jgi:hypothetical protein